MKTFKVLIKKRLPVLHHFSRSVVKSIPRKMVVNYFSTHHKKSALLSYITIPFSGKQDLTHTNSYEAISIATILKDMGYNVDVIDYNNDKHVDFSKYVVMVGFGDAFTNYYQSGYSHLKTVFYATGMHICHQNIATLKRLKQVYLKKGQWITKSIRYVDKSWMHQTALADGIIALGNHVSKDSYAKYYDGPIYSIPAPFYSVLDPYKMLLKKTKASSKGFLWFGGNGLIHKGLDLTLEAASNNPEINLHVCGPISNEPEFKEMYYKELYKTPNIKTYDFIDINSDVFIHILDDCSFSILPSCSEGGSASIITSIGNGALIPVITNETSFSTGSEIWIEDLTAGAVEKAIAYASALETDEIHRLQKENVNYVLKNHSQAHYYSLLKTAIEDIISNSLTGYHPA